MACAKIRPAGPGKEFRVVRWIEVVGNVVVVLDAWGEARVCGDA